MLTYPAQIKCDHEGCDMMIFTVMEYHGLEGIGYPHGSTPARIAPKIPDGWYVSPLGGNCLCPEHNPENKPKENKKAKNAFADLRYGKLHWKSGKFTSRGDLGKKEDPGPLEELDDLFPDYSDRYR